MAVLALYNSMQAAKTADITGAMSLEVLKGTIKAFDPRPHSLKKT
ncbi:aromatic amino acid lyase [Peribacillus frigoritolerans]|nr:aromatic amino acid lyase [Peribacillus frigoritolerans]